jgi:hypothetical protein
VMPPPGRMMIPTTHTTCHHSSFHDFRPSAAWFHLWCNSLKRNSMHTPGTLGNSIEWGSWIDLEEMGFRESGWTVNSSQYNNAELTYHHRTSHRENKKLKTSDRSCARYSSCEREKSIFTAKKSSNRFAQNVALGISHLSSHSLEMNYTEYDKQ